MTHTEGHSDWWPTHCFVFIQPILTKYVWRAKVSCLFWSFHLWNEDSLACCVAGVDLGSKDTEVARGRCPPHRTHLRRILLEGRRRSVMGWLNLEHKWRPKESDKPSEESRRVVVESG